MSNDQNTNQLVSVYLLLRDSMDEMERQHKDKKAILRARMDKIEVALAKILDHHKIESLSVDGATVFRSTKRSATVADWDAALDYIKSKGAYHLLEQRVNTTAVLAVMEEEKVTVPGVNIKSFTKTNIRRK